MKLMMDPASELRTFADALHVGRVCDAAIPNTNFYELSLVAPGVRNSIPAIYACDYSDGLKAVGRDGCYPIPTGPGLGVTYDWDYIARNRVSVHRFEQTAQ